MRRENHSLHTLTNKVWLIRFETVHFTSVSDCRVKGHNPNNDVKEAILHL